jgi:hypothetical protein
MAATPFFQVSPHMAAVMVAGQMPHLLSTVITVVLAGAAALKVVL